MSTPASIARIKRDGTVVATYVHWDGDVRYAGTTLCDHFLSHPRRIHRLIRMGFLSRIAPQIFPADPDSHRVYPHEAGTCVFHHRDMGRSWDSAKPLTFPSVQQWLDYMLDMGCARAYLYCHRKEGGKDFAVYHHVEGKRKEYLKEIGWLTDIVAAKRRNGHLPVPLASGSESPEPDRSFWLITEYGELSIGEGA